MKLYIIGKLNRSAGDLWKGGTIAAFLLVYMLANFLCSLKYTENESSDSIVQGTFYKNYTMIVFENTLTT